MLSYAWIWNRRQDSLFLSLSLFPLSLSLSLSLSNAIIIKIFYEFLTKAHASYLKTEHEYTSCSHGDLNSLLNRHCLEPLTILNPILPKHIGLHVLESFLWMTVISQNIKMFSIIVFNISKPTVASSSVFHINKKKKMLK